MDNDILKNNKLYWLPQVSAPFNYVVSSLKKEEIPYSRYEINLSELTPLQDKVKPDTVEYFKKLIINGKKLKPIFISNNNEILDGHHRYIANKVLYGDEKNLMCYKINTDTQTAARALNKIQDRFEFDNSQESKLEPIAKYLKKPEIHWYESLKNVEYFAYRKESIKNNSESGNFFYMEKKDQSMLKYKIRFDNLMYIPTHLMDNTQELPTVWLSKKLIPEKNFEEMSSLNNIPIQNLVNREIAKKVKEYGFDGINYGDKILQTLD
jgi:hypothetical protein